MASPLPDLITPIDGRSARRERGRIAVIDAMFELLQKTEQVPSVESLSQQAGVSVASIFRYFAGMDELQRETFARFGERFASMLELPESEGTTRKERINTFVDRRIAFYEEASPLLRVAQARVVEKPHLAHEHGVFRNAVFSDLAQYFVDDCHSKTQLAILDTITSPEAWDILRRLHHLPPREISEAWKTAVAALFGADDQES